MGRGASQNSRPESFPGVREKSLKKLISPTLPSLLVFFLPTPPAPPRNTRHSEISIIHLHQKNLASYKLAADPPLRLVFSRSCIMSVK